MSIGKHYFHLKEYSILQLLYADTSPAYKNCRIEYSFRWKWNYRYTYFNAVFFNEMGNKKKKIWEIKTIKNLRTRRSCTLSHFSNANFEKFIMTAKASKLHN